LISSILLFLLATLLLVGGSELVSRGTASMARHLSISETMIGMTIIAFSTSSPELLVNVFASAGDYPDIAFGNIIGSNIFNILIITGVIGLLCPFSVKRASVLKLLPFSIITTILFWIIINDVALFGSNHNELSRLDGGILVLGVFQFFLFYIIYQLALSHMKLTGGYALRVPDLLTKPFKEKEAEPEPDDKRGIIYTPVFSTIFFLIGIASLIIGGYLVVNEAVVISRDFGPSHKLLSLSFIAIFTSIPELTFSIITLRRGDNSLAAANLLGSNIFNISFVMGISAFIKPLSFNTALNTDMFILVLTSMMLYFLFSGKRVVKHWEATALIITYLAYLSFIVVRG